MRLVTYDRGGQRRLGAILEGEVVDLPDAVGHPAFPTTLEGLVSSSRGSVLDAAREAVTRDDAWDQRVKRPRILTPLFPRSLLSPGALDVERTLVGPEQDVPFPLDAAWLEYEPKVAAVIGNEARKVEPGDIRDHLFGYTLVNDWMARDASGGPVATADGVPIAIGPCVVTADELDPQTMFLQVKIDGTEVAKGNLNGAAQNLFRLVSGASQLAELERGDAFALGPFEQPDPDPQRQLWPGATVELAAEGIGTLRNRVSTRLLSL
ncbi:MAG TPA: fumarylacetoacetate hydrolase family protein [Actinomycetota bacterium]|nr:fumarylacetoacetate hydrolase family protein [Actinomycetota bacterium]